tara:strand:- start:2665 stop:2979 length:315 start_codon:yes stop_codon:yes gene_type:complete
MLVLNDIVFNLTQKKSPVVQKIYDHRGKQLIAVGLAHGATLHQYQSSPKTKIMVVQGEIDVNTETHSYRLERFDSFDVPEEPYSITGVFDAVFLLMNANTQTSQ